MTWKGSPGPVEPLATAAGAAPSPSTEPSARAAPADAASSTVVEATPFAAIASLTLGFASLIVLPLGPVALALGLVARHHARRARSSAGGARAATAGIVIGVLSTVACCTLAFLIATAEWDRPLPRWPALARPAPVQAPGLPLSRESGSSSMENAADPSPLPQQEGPPDGAGVATRRIGAIVLVDVGPTVRSLSDELHRQERAAEEQGRRTLLWLVAPDCAPCSGVASSLEDARMQRALASVRLVRVDATEFAAELAPLGIPTGFAPGFALLGLQGQAVDYIHGGEWDGDVPENVAPVLESFISGTLVRRRHPWRGGPRTDETPI